MLEDRRIQPLEAYFTPVAANRDLKPFCGRISAQIFFPDTFKNSMNVVRNASRSPSQSMGASEKQHFKVTMDMELS
jgi:hypothetical protein